MRPPAGASPPAKQGPWPDGCCLSSSEPAERGAERSRPRSSDRRCARRLRHKRHRRCTHSCRFAPRSNSGEAACCSFRRWVVVQACRQPLWAQLGQVFGQVPRARRAAILSFDAQGLRAHDVAPLSPPGRVAASTSHAPTRPTHRPGRQVASSSARHGHLPRLDRRFLYAGEPLSDGSCGPQPARARLSWRRTALECCVAKRLPCVEARFGWRPVAPRMAQGLEAAGLRAVVLEVRFEEGR
jgi:hypothetical protein